MAYNSGSLRHVYLTGTNFTEERFSERSHTEIIQRCHYWYLHCLGPQHCISLQRHGSEYAMVFPNSRQIQLSRGAY